jgi:D-tyrosyl-tRNA(Tyr) deacylase
MRAVIQRVSGASVKVEEKVVGEIGRGLMVLVGIEEADGEEDIQWLSGKIVQLRIFDDETGTMNLSVKDLNGEILLVSQFTLHASTKKGNRPSYIRAAKPEQAKKIYERMTDVLSTLLSKSVATGRFQAMMQVSLVNDGPVTIIIDSKNKE